MDDTTAFAVCATSRVVDAASARAAIAKYSQDTSRPVATTSLDLAAEFLSGYANNAPPRPRQLIHYICRRSCPERLGEFKRSLTEASAVQQRDVLETLELTFPSALQGMYGGGIAGSGIAHTAGGSGVTALLGTGGNAGAASRTDDAASMRDDDASEASPRSVRAARPPGMTLYTDPTSGTMAALLRNSASLAQENSELREQLQHSKSAVAMAEAIAAHKCVVVKLQEASGILAAVNKENIRLRSSLESGRSIDAGSTTPGGTSASPAPAFASPRRQVEVSEAAAKHDVARLVSEAQSETMRQERGRFATTQAELHGRISRLEKESQRSVDDLAAKTMASERQAIDLQMQLLDAKKFAAESSSRASDLEADVARLVLERDRALSRLASATAEAHRLKAALGSASSARSDDTPGRAFSHDVEQASMPSVAELRSPLSPNTAAREIYADLGSASVENNAIVLSPSAPATPAHDGAAARNVCCNCGGLAPFASPPPKPPSPVTAAGDASVPPVALQALDKPGQQSSTGAQEGVDHQPPPQWIVERERLLQKLSLATKLLKDRGISGATPSILSPALSGRAVPTRASVPPMAPLGDGTIKPPPISAEQLSDKDEKPAVGVPAPTLRAKASVSREPSVVVKGVRKPHSQTGGRNPPSVRH